MTMNLNISDPKKGITGETSAPFVGHNIPLVGCIRPRVLPFVGFKLPFVTIREKQRGFTLIELLITMVVVGILSAVAAPSITSFFKNNRMVSQSNDFLADLTYARIEAIKRSGNVVICRSIDQATCDTAGGGDGNYSTGWLVFYDADSSTEYESGGDDFLLTTSGVLSGGNGLTTTIADYKNFAAYNRTGLLTAGVAASFNLCDDRGASKGRLISINLTGRASIGQSPTCP